MSDEFRIAAVSYRALHLKYCALHEEMQVMSDKLTCALLEAKENEEIANEFKLTMQDLEAKLKEKNT